MNTKGGALASEAARAEDSVRVTGLDHVAFESTDPDAAVSFYRDVWGLQPDPPQRDGTVALMVPAHGPRLLIVPSDRDSLGHVAFSCRELGPAGPDTTAGLACDERPGQPRRVLRDPDGRTVELLGSDEMASGGEEPTDRVPAPAADPHAPVMGHVVLASPDLEASEAFYRDRLGFRSTDRTARGMVFMRCNTDHHTLAIARTSVPGVQHVAYDVGTIDQLMQNLARLRAVGVTCVWGPGRHGPGHNVFAYYRDPLGCVIEQFADMERVGAGDPGEERWWGPDWPGDLWGLAGPPSAEFLESVLAVGVPR